jgi:hypothetical protein
MVEAYLVLCALGIALWLACGAFAWSDRANAFRSHPVCAKCGYDLGGIGRTQLCPECGSKERSFRAGSTGRKTVAGAWALWVGPVVFGAVLTSLCAIVLGMGSMRAQVTTAIAIGAYLVVGVAARIATGVLSVTFGRVLAVLGSACCTVGLLAFAAIGQRIENKASAPIFFSLAPALGLAFGGYGLALSFLVMSIVHNRQKAVPVLLNSSN